MWLAIDSVKNKESDIIISAGNTGALFIIAKLNLKMSENIDKPALSGLWPNKNGTNIVLDLGANVECNEKNLIDFSLMGSALFKALFPDQNPKVALLNIGSEEIKGNEIIKNTYQKISQTNNLNYEFKGFIEGNNIMNGGISFFVPANKLSLTSWPLIKSIALERKIHDKSKCVKVLETIFFPCNFDIV